MATKIPFAAISVLMLAAHPTFAAKHANGAPQGPILWSDLRVGMNTHQVNAVLRHAHLLMTQDCTATVKPEYVSGRLSEISLSGASHGRARQECAQAIEQTLAEKYGQQNKSVWRVGGQSLFTPGPMSPFVDDVSKLPSERFQVAEWTLSDTSILFRSNIRSGSWAVTYAPNAQPVSPAKL